jgi:hypothetical protein
LPFLFKGTFSFIKRTGEERTPTTVGAEAAMKAGIFWTSTRV